MTRIIAYVDGFNMFHAVEDLVHHPDPKIQIPHNRANLWALIDLIKKPTETLEAVHYFSAYATWLPAQYAAHQRYVAALQTAGVTVTMSHFKHKKTHCKKCSATWMKPEEKETDVRIAMQIVADAFDNKFDRAYIVSGDSDLVPTLQFVRSRFPQKGVFALIPPKRHKYARDIIKHAHAASEIKHYQVRKSLFVPKP